MELLIEEVFKSWEFVCEICFISGLLRRFIGGLVRI